MPSLNPQYPTSGLEALHQGFLALLPRVQLHATIFFRYLRCPHRREDAIAETVALAWAWYRHLIEKGRDPTPFITTLATYAARHVRSGRKLCGQEPGKDVLSPLAQARHGFVIGRLPDWETLSTNPLTDALTDNTRSPVDEQVCFRIDFPCWLNRLSERDRQVVEDLMLGERTLDVASKHRLSPGRVSQLRREFLHRWERFCGEGEDGRADTLV